ncbi:MAG TPA: nicotinate-nucleotide--dimethylbenzimidazole phosphoribosyltransferase [Dehalococcoidales bacterium]|nr:nicotinate-nucleotide--dimethylbenzimidazole phosphoribosyltransferase [Dehalococcoidales bacterium]
MRLLTETVKKIQPLDRKCMEAAKNRQDNLTKPAGSLGRLEELSIQLAGIQGVVSPQVKRKAFIVMASDHGVAAEGTSAYPQEVTFQMLANIAAGGAAISVLSRQIGARLVAVDIGVKGDTSVLKNVEHCKVAPGTQSLLRGPAMTADEAVRAIETGITLVKAEVLKGLDIVGTGEMGIGNTTPSAAICAVMTGKSAAEVTGRGTGLDDRGLQHKVNVIEKAIALNKPDAGNALEVLSKVGGFEIGGLAGVIIGAAASRVPVMIDGFISGAAALIAAGICPLAKDYMVAAHMSVEPGHRILLEYLGLQPLINLNLRLGEGTGGAIGMYMAEAACRILGEMATFAEAGVSNKE